MAAEAPLCPQCLKPESYGSKIFQGGRLIRLAYWCRECGHISHIEPTITRRPDSKPRFGLDAETVARQKHPLLIVEQLVDRTENPFWDRDKLCHQCEGWTPKDGEDAKPKRPGAPDPVEGCTGCRYSMLDDRLEGQKPSPSQQPKVIVRVRRRVLYLGPQNLRWEKGEHVIEPVAVSPYEEVSTLFAPLAHELNPPGADREYALPRRQSQPEERAQERWDAGAAKIWARGLPDKKRRKKR